MNLRKLLLLIHVFPAVIFLICLGIFVSVAVLPQVVKTYFPPGPIATPTLPLPTDGSRFVVTKAYFAHHEPVNRVRFGPFMHDAVVVHFSETRPRGPVQGIPRQNFYLTDGAGRVYKDDYTVKDPELRYITQEGFTMPDFSRNRPGDQVAKFRVNLKNIPTAAGQVTFHAELFAEEKVPLKVQVIVRERDDWHRLRSNLLALKSWKLVKEKSGTMLQLVLAYRGQKTLSTLIPRQSVMSAADSNFWGSGLLLDRSPPLQAAVNQMRLVTHWSQRLEDAKGQGFWLEPKSRDLRATVFSSKYDEKDKKCMMSYRLSTTNLPKIGQLFFAAEIGVENDGFLPVKIPIRDAKGRWATN